MIQEVTIPRLNDKEEQSVEALLVSLNNNYVKMIFKRYNMVIEDLEKYMNESVDDYKNMIENMRKIVWVMVGLKEKDHLKYFFPHDHVEERREG